MVETYEVLARHLPCIEAKIAKLEKLAVRNGLTPPRIVRVGPAKVVQRSRAVHIVGDAFANDVWQRLDLPAHDVTIRFGDLGFNGWTVLGVGRPADREFDAEEAWGKVVWSSLPGQTVPAEVVHRHDMGCDHCRKARLRNYVLAVQHDGGEVRQVGGDCALLYTDGLTPHAAAVWAGALADLLLGLEDREESGEPAVSGVSMTRLAAATLAGLREVGWISRRRADETGEFSTSGWVKSTLWDLDCPDSFGTEAAAERLLEFGRQWAETTDPEGLGEYQFKVRLALLSDTITERQIGLAVSAIPFVQRMMGEAVQRPEVGHLGKVGERVRDLAVTVTDCRSLGMGQYGERWLWKLQTAAGHALTWFTSSGNEDLIGRSLTVDATVKNHEAYQGKPQTILTRVKVKEALAVAA